MRWLGAGPEFILVFNIFFHLQKTQVDKGNVVDPVRFSSNKIAALNNNIEYYYTTVT